MKRPERSPSKHFIPELIEKQKKKEKKNPIFKRNKPRNRWAL